MTGLLRYYWQAGQSAREWWTVTLQAMLILNWQRFLRVPWDQNYFDSVPLKREVVFWNGKYSNLMFAFISNIQTTSSTRRLPWRNGSAQDFYNWNISWTRSWGCGFEPRRELPFFILKCLHCLYHLICLRIYWLIFFASFRIIWCWVRRYWSPFSL